MKIYLSECKKNWGNKKPEWQEKRGKIENELNGMVKVLNLSGKDIVEIRSVLGKELDNE